MREKRLILTRDVDEEMIGCVNQPAQRDDHEKADGRRSRQLRLWRITWRHDANSFRCVSSEIFIEIGNGMSGTPLGAQQLSKGYAPEGA